MADEQQVDLINQGPDVWNEWRKRNPSIKVDLTRANLADADMSEADLSDANLTGADMPRVNLVSTNLSGTKLIDANLTGAILSEANLSKADLTAANLRDTNLTDANLTDALLIHATLIKTEVSRVDLTGAVFRETVLADLDLSRAVGLDSIRHFGPSTVDHRTLLRSGHLPLSFLRGCGLPDRLIDYLPSLLNAGPIQFYSCFISYSTANQDFAERLHADLQSRGVRCWFAPHDMAGGKKIHDQIDEAIRVYDRLLLILSRDSMSSRWVKTEIEKARDKEVRSGRNVLFPLALVPFSEIQEWRQFNADLGEDTARAVREFFVPDFSGWETNHGNYLESFEKLLTSLKNADERLRTEGTAAETNGFDGRDR